jgi:hypothetical protein
MAKPKESKLALEALTTYAFVNAGPVDPVIAEALEHAFRVKQKREKVGAATGGKRGNSSPADLKAEAVQRVAELRQRRGLSVVGACRHVAKALAAADPGRRVNVPPETVRKWWNRRKK